MVFIVRYVNVGIVLQATHRSEKTRTQLRDLHRMSLPFHYSSLVYSDVRTE